jgi:hypothetical protein
MVDDLDPHIPELHCILPYLNLIKVSWVPSSSSLNGRVSTPIYSSLTIEEIAMFNDWMEVKLLAHPELNHGKPWLDEEDKELIAELKRVGLHYMEWVEPPKEKQEHPS